MSTLLADSLIGALPDSPPGITGSNPPASGANDLSSLVTDLAGAAQLGLGIYNETQGGPQINPLTGKAIAPPTTIAGFSITAIIVGAVLIVGAILAVHFLTK